jgi:hypothetical protein
MNAIFENKKANNHSKIDENKIDFSNIVFE